MRRNIDFGERSFGMKGNKNRNNVIILFAFMLTSCMTTEVNNKLTLVKASNTDRYGIIYRKKVFYQDDMKELNSKESALETDKLRKLVAESNLSEEAKTTINLVIETGYIHSCFESPGPASITNHMKATLEAIKSVEFDKAKASDSQKAMAEYNQKLATLYTVGEIIQFGQNALFRLCEARGNGDFTAKSYRANFELILNSMVDLLSIANGKEPVKRTRTEY